MKSNYKRLGDYIRQVDVRNKDLRTKKLLGINIDKFFMPSVANIIGTDLSNYKLIEKGQFACNPMHVGRDERIPVSLYLEEDYAIVSPAYFVFEITNTSLLSKYLMLWFKRPEFDRECWFYTDASIRGGITWEDFCDKKLPIPSIEEQQKIVDAYETIEKRIAIKKKINDVLSKCINLVFYNNCKNDTILKTKIRIGEFCKIFTGKKDVNESLPHGQNRFYSCSPIPTFSNEKIYEGKAILIAGNGSFTGRTIFVDEAFDLYQRTYALTPIKKEYEELLYVMYASLKSEFQETLHSKIHGSAIPYIVYSDIADFCFEYNINFHESTEQIARFIKEQMVNDAEISSLNKLMILLLAKIVC